MPKIDRVSWGKVKIDGQNYHQVLIIGDQVEERDGAQLRKLFNTTHRIGDWEQKKLLSENPDVILIARGWSGVLKVSQEFKDKISQHGIELREVSTPKIAQEYHRLLAEKKKVNVLVHTTC